MPQPRAKPEEERRPDATRRATGGIHRHPTQRGLAGCEFPNDDSGEWTPGELLRCDEVELEPDQRRAVRQDAPARRDLRDQQQAPAGFRRFRLKRVRQLGSPRVRHLDPDAAVRRIGVDLDGLILHQRRVLDAVAHQLADEEVQILDRLLGHVRLKRPQRLASCACRAEVARQANVNARKHDHH